MSSLKSRLLGAAAGLAATTGFAGVVLATDISGGGATLPAPAFAQSWQCYSGAATGVDYLVRNSSGNLVTTAAPACPPSAITPINTAVKFHYAATGSGLGIAGFFSHDPSRYGTYPATPFASVKFGLSDNALKQSDLDAYNSGGTVQGVTVVAPGVTPTPGTNYANPFQKFGKLLQVPDVIGAVAVVYRLPAGVKINTPTGKLQLTKKAYCDIFNGNITKWSQLPNVTLTGTTDPAITRVGRLDSSGTTSLFTRHLAAVCTSSAGNVFTNTAGTTLLPSTTGWTLGAGNSGVATAVNGKKGAIGYVGSEFLGGGKYLKAAELQAGSSATFLLPTATNAAAGFNASGFPVPTSTATLNPLNWVPTQLNSSIANPSSGYPIIGTSNVLLYSCYSTADEVAALTDPTKGFFHWYYTAGDPNGSSGILAQNGVAALPKTFRLAIDKFLRKYVYVKNAVSACKNKGA